MKNLFISVIVLLYMQKAFCTHLETCDCHEIRSLINASLEQAIARLENKLTSEIQSVNSRISHTANGIRTEIANMNTQLNHTSTDSAIENQVEIAVGKITDIENSLASIVNTNLKSILQHLEYHLPLPHQSEDTPADSCRAMYEAYQNIPSGYYWIKSSSGTPEEVYCQMDPTDMCGNATGGWMRVAYLNMSDPSHECPSGFTCTVRTTNPTRTCDMPGSGYCIGTKFAVHGRNYSHVYGRIIAYQKGDTRAFSTSYDHYGIDGPYLYGVSLTHGQNPRKHVWSFAGARDQGSSSSNYKCPCMTRYSSSYIPSYVGDDYFCDSGTNNYYWYYSSSKFYNNNPLWDGEGCSRSSCCSVPNLCGDKSPPWFIKELESSTTDDIELRLCRPGSYGSTPIEAIEIYVQ